MSFPKVPRTNLVAPPKDISATQELSNGINYIVYHQSHRFTNPWQTSPANPGLRMSRLLGMVGSSMTRIISVKINGETRFVDAYGLSTVYVVVPRSNPDQSLHDIRTYTVSTFSRHELSLLLLSRPPCSPGTHNTHCSCDEQRATISWSLVPEISFLATHGGESPVFRVLEMGSVSLSLAFLFYRWSYAWISLVTWIYVV